MGVFRVAAVIGTELWSEFSWRNHPAMLEAGFLFELAMRFLRRFECWEGEFVMFILFEVEEKMACDFCSTLIFWQIIRSSGGLIAQERCSW